MSRPAATIRAYASQAHTKVSRFPNAMAADGTWIRALDDRLAFRELGLAAVGLMEQDARRGPVRFSGTAGAHPRLEQLSRYAPVRAEIESF